MHAIDRPFSKIINGATQFVVPVFQGDHEFKSSGGPKRPSNHTKSRRGSPLPVFPEPLEGLGIDVLTGTG